VVEDGGALEVGVANFQPTATLTMQSGSIERWAVSGARSTNYQLPTGVHLQIEADQNQTASYGLNGGSIMGYLPVDLETQLVVNTVGANVSFNLLSDSSVGQPYPSGTQQVYGHNSHQFYDMGKANWASSPTNPVMQGGYLKLMGNITGTGQTLSKIGQDVVQLAGNNTGFDVSVREGLLQLGSSTAVPEGRSLTMRSNGVLDLSGNNVTVSTLNGDSAAAQVVNSAVTSNTVTVQSGGTYDGALRGNIHVVKQGAGVLRLNSVDNNFNGSTTVTGGTLQVAGRLSGTTSVNVTGATSRLEFVGSASNRDRINNFAAVVLGAGGRLVTNGMSEGSSAPGQSAAMGKLTLGEGAEIDFGAGANGSTLLFEGLQFADGTSVRILNWSGMAQKDDGAAGNDRLLFRTAPGFSEMQLANVQFEGDNGVSYGKGATMIGYNGYLELVPVPEPSTWLLSGLGGLLLGYRNRRRVGELLAQLRS
jgi:autotransporter-associated beta strand protein